MPFTLQDLFNPEEEEEADIVSEAQEYLAEEKESFDAMTGGVSGLEQKEEYARERYPKAAAVFDQIDRSHRTLEARKAIMDKGYYELRADTHPLGLGKREYEEVMKHHNLLDKPDKELPRLFETDDDMEDAIQGMISNVFPAGVTKQIINKGKALIKKEELESGIKKIHEAINKTQSKEKSESLLKMLQQMLKHQKDLF